MGAGGRGYGQRRRSLGYARARLLRAAARAMNGGFRTPCGGRRRKRRTREARVRRTAESADAQFGTETVLPLTVIALADVGVVTNVGTFAVVIAGAAPGMPPRGVVRTTCDAGSAVPLFRFA